MARAGNAARPYDPSHRPSEFSTRGGTAMFHNTISFCRTLLLAGAVVVLTAGAATAAPRGGGFHGGGFHGGFRPGFHHGPFGPGPRTFGHHFHHGFFNPGFRRFDHFEDRFERRFDRGFFAPRVLPGFGLNFFGPF